MDTTEKRFEQDIESFLISADGGYEQLSYLNPDGHRIHKYVYDKEKDTLTEKEVPEEMKKEALAHALLGSYLYKNRLYKGSEEK